MGWIGDLPHHDGSARYRDGEARLRSSLGVYVLEPRPGVLRGCTLRYTRDGDAFTGEAVVAREDSSGRGWRAEFPISPREVASRFILDGESPPYLNAAGARETEPPDGLDFRVRT